MENLTIKLDSQHQISTILLENLQIRLFPEQGFNDSNVNSITSFNKALRVIEEIGDVEHTNDWDPYLEIKIKEGSTLYTESGYWDLEITGETDDNGDQVCIENFIWDNRREESIRRDIILSVNEIEYIKVHR